MIDWTACLGIEGLLVGGRGLEEGAVQRLQQVLHLRALRYDGRLAVLFRRGEPNLDGEI